MISHFLIHFRQSVNVSSLPRIQPPSNWKIDSGYELPEQGEPYPYRAYGTGSHFSLTVILKVNKLDIDYLCGGSTQGFKIIFHPPNENPNASKKYFLLSPGLASYYTIEPKLVRTSDKVKYYTPDDRRCFLQTERKLQFYKNYTQRNCEVECLSNFTLAQCGCVQFAMMRKIDHRT